MAEPYSLAGKHVLITGAGSGIGRLMALGAARRGATHLVLWDLNLDSAKAVATEVEALGASALAMTVDVSKKSAVTTAATIRLPVTVAAANPNTISPGVSGNTARSPKIPSVLS